MISLFRDRLGLKQEALSKSYSGQRDHLSLEPLEDRMMLSHVTVFAAGESGQEAFQVRVNGEVAATYENVGGNPDARQFQQFELKTDSPVTADDISIQFINDAFDAKTGLDRNLYVDRIIIDGVTYETEDPAVYSNGQFGQDPGFLETESLNINGAFFYSNDGATNTAQTRIRVDASGSVGGELIAVEINGRQIETFELSQSTESFFVTVNEDVSVTDIGIRFLNDLYDPANGIDRNARIENIQTIDLNNGFREVVRLATNSRVYSTGSFLPEDGVVAGFARGNTLNTNGVFRFGAPDNTASDNPPGVFDANGDLINPTTVAKSTTPVQPPAQTGFVAADPDDDEFGKRLA